VLADPNRVEAMGAAARREVDARYDMAAMIRSRLQFYADTASKRGRHIPGLQEYAR